MHGGGGAWTIWWKHVMRNSASISIYINCGYKREKNKEKQKEVRWSEAEELGKKKMEEKRIKKRIEG